MDELERAGLVLHQDRREFLGNSLVVIVPVRSPLQIRSPRDLLSVDRIALADPAAVPAGIYARKWLESHGLWERIQKRVVPALDVRAALAAVETEALPAGIVYRTDARISKGVRVVYEVKGKPAILYSVAPIVSSDKKAAKEFVRYLASEDAARVFKSYGFGILGGR